MVTEILYSEIDQKIISKIKDKLSFSNIIFIEISDVDYFNLFTPKTDTPGIVLIGEDVNNPLQFAQKVHKFDKNVSILIISSPKNFEKFKQGLKFTPFIGNTVQCVRDESEIELSTTIEELITKTKQRRNYVKLKASAKTFLQNKPDFDQIKTDFLNKYLEYAPIGTILLDRGKIVAINAYGCHIFNEEENSLVDKHLVALFPEECHISLLIFIEDELAIQTFERRNGQDTQYLEIRVAGIPGNYKILILSDITDKFNANKKIEDQLVELKKINSDLDNFIYTASHDLKAPISNVEGLMNALTKSFSEETAGKEQVKKIVSMIFQSIGRFKTTIGDLSDISKLEKTFFEDQQELDIAEVIKDVEISISEYITESKARINSNCGSKIIYFSRQNLKSVIYNLISNAIKYRDPVRRPVIDISCVDDKDYVLIKVKDNGLGIPANKFQEIFEMFKRFHSHVEGSGIGLFIIKRIIENANGKIEVESELGKGSLFKIYIKKER